MRIAGGTAATILVILGVLHLYWAVGGQWGKGAALPEHEGRPVWRPSALGTGLVALGLFTMAALLLMRIGWLGAYPEARSVHVGVWLMAAILWLRALGDFRYVGFFKRVRGTRFARLDTLIYSPLCLLLALLITLSVSFDL
jgi:Protein of unknown function (DUF3995)